MILPELSELKSSIQRVEAVQQVTNKRLDDLHSQSLDLNRRIDDTNQRIDDTNKRIDDTNKRIDQVRMELSTRIDEFRTELNARIDEVRAELSARIDEVRTELVNRIDALNSRMDLIHQNMVRQDEHHKLEQRVEDLVYRVKRLEEGVE